MIDQPHRASIEQLRRFGFELEGHRAVKKLQRAFGFYVDRGLWGDAADLFADEPKGAADATRS